MPYEFDCHANFVYKEIGSPSIDCNNIWDVYLQIQDKLEELHEHQQAEDKEYIEQWEVQEKLTSEAEENQCPYDLIAGRGLAGGIENTNEDGSFYMGGVNSGHGLGKNTFLNVLSIPKVWHTILNVDTAMQEKLDHLEDEDEFEFEVAADFTDEESEDVADGGYEW